jgi:hypothetical protein
MKGYHVRQYIRPFHTLDEFEIYCQLLSVLFWKRNYGDIGLITDIITLNQLKPYGFLHEYSDINLTLFDEHMPKIIDKNKFWSFGKIVTAAYAPEDEFCIIDTDAYLREAIQFDKSYDFIAAHPEFTDNKKVYPALRNFIKHYTPKEDKMLAMNTSFIYCNNPLLMRVWHKLATQVACDITMRYMLQQDTSIYAKFAVTVEQRFLPLVAQRLGCNYTTIISNTYKPTTANKNVNEWIPDPRRSGNISDVSKTYFHMWGLKYAMRKDIPLRGLVYGNMTSDFIEHFPNEYAKYYKAFENLHNPTSTAWLVY